MIKNERQYRITKAQIDKFKESFSQLSKETRTTDVHPLLVKAERDALESQLIDLEREIQEYDDLRTGKIPVFELLSIEDLPKTLIKARIALGLNQRDLAERIGLQEQQIQRYESTDYESASVSRVKEIIKALNLSIGDNLLFDQKINIKNFFHRLSKVGLDRKFITQRLLPSSLAARLEENNDMTHDILGFQAAAHIGRVFGWKPDQIISSEPLLLNTGPIAQVSFKIPQKTDKTRLNVYTLYAHYIAMLISKATEHLPQKQLPSDPATFRKSVLSSYGTITFESLVRYVWDLGLPVITIDPGSFHAACFRDDNRSIIVLAQKTSSESRWMFNLMHEFYHASTGIEQIAESDDEFRESDDERIASQFADGVLLGKDPHELVTRCLDEANWNIPLLKNAVSKIADEEGVRSDVLANYLAYRLSSEHKKNWWGTAESFQKPLENARTIVSNVMLEYIDFSVIAEPDLELLKQTLNINEMTING